MGGIPAARGNCHCTAFSKLLNNKIKACRLALPQRNSQQTPQNQSPESNSLQPGVVMRTMHELLTILRDNAMVYHDKIYSGLCHETNYLLGKDIISYKERNLLRNYINENIPNRKNGYILNYAWQVCEWPPRLAWLNEHIELTRQQSLNP